MKWRKNTSKNISKIPPYKKPKDKLDNNPIRISGYRKLLLKVKFQNWDEGQYSFRFGYYNTERKRFFVEGMMGDIEVSHFCIIRKPLDK